MPYRLTLLACLLLPAVAQAGRPTLRFKPASADPDDRPVAIEVELGTQGSNYALRVTFDKLPWGEACKNRCANATLFIDTDDSRSTGLRPTDAKAPEAGADVAITIQGVREYKELSADLRLRIKVRHYGGNARSPDEGSTLAELDHRRDRDRIRLERTTVLALIDATDTLLPVGPRMRLIYHPPGAEAVVAHAPGMTARGAGTAKIFPMADAR